MIAGSAAAKAAPPDQPAADGEGAATYSCCVCRRVGGIGPDLIGTATGLVAHRGLCHRQLWGGESLSSDG